MTTLSHVTFAAVLLLLMAATGHAQPPRIEQGRLERCVDAASGVTCKPTTIEQIDLADPVVHVRKTVRIPAAASGMPLPVAVTLVGTMSSDVRWNGVPIGANGFVGAQASSEKPGRFNATILVPRELVHTGENTVDVRMSAHHRWLPINVPIQQIRVGYFEGRGTSELRTYWPALLTAGALVLAALYFAVAASVGRDRRTALTLMGVAICAALQLVIETSRAFFDYPYPWHIARIAAIVLLAVATSVLMASYTAHRYTPRRTNQIIATAAAISAASALLLPTFDAKAWGCLFGVGLICLLCAACARDRMDGRIGIVVAALFLSMLLWGGAGALDRGYYLFMAVLLSGLVAEEVFGLRRVYSGLAVEQERNDVLALRLKSSTASEKSILSFKDGASVHRFAEDDIVRIAAADDFCEITLTSRRPLLVGGTLKALAESLPDRFLRVHKSYIVNLAHVAAMNPKPGGGHELVLSDKSSTPVGRTYRGAVLARLQPAKEGNDWPNSFNI